MPLYVLMLLEYLCYKAQWTFQREFGRVLVEESNYSSDCVKLSLNLGQSQYEETQKHQQLTHCWECLRKETRWSPSPCYLGLKNVVH